MKAELRNLLLEGISAIDSELAADLTLVSGLERLFDEISLFNPSYKLVAGDDRDLVVKHILDCLAPVSIMRKNADGLFSFADLGSGSGLPGIVLAMALADRSFTLVERMGRRAGFLRNTLAITGLSSRTSVLEKDLGEINESFEVITFRAFRHMKDIAKDLVRITHPGSVVFAYKSSEDDIQQELNCLTQLTGNVFDTRIISYSVPFLDAKRSLLILKRVH